ncbi:MAG: UdgX family uracil-DNA binding protein [Bryobacteraceae bacterium]
MERTPKAPAGKGQSAAEFLPETRSLHALEQAARGCRGCDLYRFATQTVFGEGHSPGRIMLVGEQPGDQEDVQGHPFVGPAGKLLDRALEAAGVAREEVYVTNAVKHFKFEREGKRRIHKKPGAPEISACRPWLEAEVETVRPKLIVCMGATASQSVLGRAVRIQKERGSFLPHHSGIDVMVTIHPSALLRLQTHEQREREFERFVSELKSAKEHAA